MTSVERVVEYANLPSERSLDTDHKVSETLPKSWPTKGVIKFNNVSLKYSAMASAFVLHNLTFTVHQRVSLCLIYIKLLLIFISICRRKSA